jgi:hypothetical protein
MCQWLPDIDTLTYLFAISDSHALGHRGLLTHQLAAGISHVFCSPCVATGGLSK